MKSENSEDLEMQDIIKNTGTVLESENSNDIIKIYRRSCPKCNKILNYKKQVYLDAAIKNKSLCRNCHVVEIPIGGWKKQCPKCGINQSYTCKYTLESSIKKNTCCNKCSGDNKSIIVPNDGWKRSCPRCKNEYTYTCKSTLINSTRNSIICLKCRVEIRHENEWIKRCMSCSDEVNYNSKELLESENMCNQPCTKCNSNKISLFSIGNLERKCPVCFRWISYKTRKGVFGGNKRHSPCLSCSGKIGSLKHDKSFMRTDAYRNKMSESLKKSKKIFTEEYREKLRNRKLDSIAKLGTQTAYNVDACKFIDNINKKFSWNLQHALNGGEIRVSGYHLDGYDKDRNIVFEYDEPKHDTAACKEKDIKRQNRIINKINPIQFWRYSERYNHLKEIISNTTILC